LTDESCHPRNDPMSYLDPPRLHFRGRFFADPSTINNSITNYDTTVVYNNRPPSASNPTSVFWNEWHVEKAQCLTVEAFTMSTERPSRKQWRHVQLYT
jgi:hypothetical protein